MKVSCIMPTKGRPQFVADSMRMFMAQDYPDKELLILDAGERPVRTPRNPAIIHIRDEPRSTSVGAMRNKLCEAASGELIAHWDDDDIYMPQRLSVQIKTLLDAKAQICGLNHVRCLDMDTGEAFEKDMGRLGSAGVFWLDGPTLLYRKSAWQQRPFVDRTAGEEYAFVAGRGADVVVVDHPEIFTHRFHKGSSTRVYGKQAQYAPGP